MLVTSGIFRDVSMIISLHLVEENLGLRSGGSLDQMTVNEGQDVVAILVEFLLNLLLIVSNQN